MLRTCPKCGAFSADGSPFCLTDGTPLLNVNPTSKVWGEGSRIAEEQGKKLVRQIRRLKWQRVVTTGVTTVIVTMVVTMVAVNSWIYLKPNVNSNVIANNDRNHNINNHVILNDDGNHNVNVNINHNGNGNVNVNHNNNANVNVNVNHNSNANVNGNVNHNSNVNGNVNVNHNSNANVNVNVNHNNNVNVNANHNSNSNTNTDNDDTGCSVTDQERETKAILKKINAEWQWNSESERIRVLSLIAGSRAQETFVEPVSVTHDPISFSEKCTRASVRFTSVWRTSRSGSPAPARVLRSSSTTFRCQKNAIGWSCSGRARRLPGRRPGALRFSAQAHSNLKAFSQPNY